MPKETPERLSDPHDDAFNGQPITNQQPILTTPVPAQQQQNIIRDEPSPLPVRHVLDLLIYSSCTRCLARECMDCWSLDMSRLGSFLDFEMDMVLKGNRVMPRAATPPSGVCLSSIKEYLNDDTHIKHLFFEIGMILVSSGTGDVDKNTCGSYSYDEDTYSCVCPSFTAGVLCEHEFSAYHRVEYEVSMSPHIWSAIMMYDIIPCSFLNTMNITALAVAPNTTWSLVYDYTKPVVRNLTYLYYYDCEGREGVSGAECTCDAPVNDDCADGDEKSFHVCRDSIVSVLNNMTKLSQLLAFNKVELLRVINASDHAIITFREPEAPPTTSSSSPTATHALTATQIAALGLVVLLTCLIPIALFYARRSKIESSLSHSHHTHLTQPLAYATSSSACPPTQLISRTNNVQFNVNVISNMSVPNSAPNANTAYLGKNQALPTHHSHHHLHHQNHNIHTMSNYNTANRTPITDNDTDCCVSCAYYMHGWGICTCCVTLSERTLKRFTSVKPASAPPLSSSSPSEGRSPSRSPLSSLSSSAMLSPSASMYSQSFRQQVVRSEYIGALDPDQPLIG
eukprot:TRINITY_DN4729_c0_g1::TRINITY_DN4729_c0_g1_i1::g.21278::m.21278 TRINITY_DN4729_c0_g1::TRINITY_DN4729_c0_g1_i1::g.21278  ORF type:complete len:586 (+),score=67.13,bZIP_C/PF12498.3/1.1e+04,bZIP_C/PF12498.3/48,bZIP_C/PF12498.3/0.46 TRINITY_DN4729_c0_g1_i1:60-1760(+)